MSLLSKLLYKNNQSISRRELLNTVVQDVGLFFLLDRYGKSNTRVSSINESVGLDSLIFKPTKFIEAYPSVKDEIVYFLSQEEVKKAFGFDPLTYKDQIVLNISEGSILQGYGVHYDESAWINGYLFSNANPELELIQKGFKSHQYQKDIDMLKELRADKEMLKLYRGLLVTHEIAHVIEWHTKNTKNPLLLTGHGVTNRIEIRILTNLYQSGKVPLKTCEKIIGFTEKYLNSMKQPKAEIDDYYKNNFINFKK